MKNSLCISCFLLILSSCRGLELAHRYLYKCIYPHDSRRAFARLRGGCQKRDLQVLSSMVVTLLDVHEHIGMTVSQYEW